MNTEVLFTDLLVTNMTGGQCVSSACLLLHYPKAILILVKYPNLILTGDLNALGFGGGRKIFLMFLECFPPRCYVHDDFDGQ